MYIFSFKLLVDPGALIFFSVAAKLVVKILEFHNFMIIIFSNDKKKSIEVVDGGANQANSPTSSNEIELGTIPILRQQRDWIHTGCSNSICTK